MAFLGDFFFICSILRNKLITNFKIRKEPPRKLAFGRSIFGNLPVPPIYVLPQFFHNSLGLDRLATNAQVVQPCV